MEQLIFSFNESSSDKTHIICYSGGIESALVAIEVARKYGTENMLLVNHDISANAEEQDIKQYKTDIADYLGLPVTFVNADEQFPHLDPIKACIDIGGFKFGRGDELFTCKLKTEPFHKWLKENFTGYGDCVIYYGFTTEEPHRMVNRREILNKMGYESDYPLFWENRTIHDTAEIGIPKPKHYDTFKHGNCSGCLKAGWQHWYCIYVHRPDRWKLAKEAEAAIGYSINQRNKVPCFLHEREEEFELLKQSGLPATEHIHYAKFWSMARKLLKQAA